MSVAGARGYALGMLPIGDVLVAWGGSTPMAESIGLQPAEQILGRPRWLVYMGGGLLVGSLAAVLTFWRRRQPDTPYRDPDVSDL